MTKYNIVASTEDVTVVAEYKAEYRDKSSAHQSEAKLEKEFIKNLVDQGYEYLSITKEDDLIDNLKEQLEKLNNIVFSDAEWDSFFKKTISSANEGIVEKTRKIQQDHIQLLERDDKSIKNIILIDKKNIHNNKLQVINQYEEEGGKYRNRYDITILVNGLPLIHIELKRRGIAIREAFNQIKRYQHESFWASHGLFEYVQLFVISNGTNTKYYSNTTRDAHIKEASKNRGATNLKTSNSFKFTSFWADSNNKIIPDLVDFTKTFFTKHTVLNILIHYCVFTAEDLLLVMRPYQIAATERIINRIKVSDNYKQAGKKEAGGYIWHTTGSGKTLTSFKAAVLATEIESIDKVIFVVDRKDLDNQTMKEYDRFEKGAANSNVSTSVLQRQLENKGEKGAHHDYKIIITTIQKLANFIKRNKKHEVYDKRVVLIFDECHRSQFGEMHKAIIKSFKNYHIFGFTGTPIFAANAPSGGNAGFLTTEQVFGEKLHTYTIVDAINDNNVLPFRIDFINTVKPNEEIQDEKVPGIDAERALSAPERINLIVEYILKHFDQKTKRDSFYTHTIKNEKRKVAGFNSIFAVSSIPMAIKYYRELKKQIEEKNKNLKIATIFSFAPNEEEIDGMLADEEMGTDTLDQSSRDFLESAIADYNKYFSANYDTSSEQFGNYYENLSMRVKNREIDILIVVNMFLTGFDATTLNTLWVDKNLRLHGLIQAFSRTNRILNSVKSYGNIVCFRDLKQNTDDAIALFGDKDAKGIVLLKTYEEYYEGYEADDSRQDGYRELVEKLSDYPIDEEIRGENNKREFVKLFGKILKVRNILSSFDEFIDDDLLSDRDMQDYLSKYNDIYEEFKKEHAGEKADIIDDIVFEIELVKQIEVNIDYILMLVAKYKEENCKDKDILKDIEKAIDSSIELRNKKDLINGFIERVNVTTIIEKDWEAYIKDNKEKDIEKLIKEENLKADKAKIFIENSFRDGFVKTIGTDITDIMPRIKRFQANNERQIKKQNVIDKILALFERYFGM